jgi:hypothetical protein
MVSLFRPREILASQAIKSAEMGIRVMLETKRDHRLPLHCISLANKRRSIDMPNSPDPLFGEYEAADLGPAEDGGYEVLANTTIKELRLILGPKFAPGYEEQDLVGKFLANGGYSSLDEYLSRHHTLLTQPDGK